jgi:hypothetical protein
MKNHINSKFDPIYIFVNMFNLQSLVLTSYLLFMAIKLLRSLPCHIIFHSLHDHLIIETICYLF